LDEVEFRLHLGVEDLVLLYTIARSEGVSVHELVLRAVRRYIADRMPAGIQEPKAGDKGQGGG